jgi:hypothetical protein
MTTGHGLTKEAFVRILRAAGLDDAGLARFHRELEHTSPQAHDELLRWLAIPAHEAARIRRDAALG